MVIIIIQNGSYIRKNILSKSVSRNPKINMLFIFEK